MYSIGLTGGFCSGKSLVSSLFFQLGVSIIDADDISRKLTSTNGVAIPNIRQAFGEKALAPDGSLNRRWMREKIFSSQVARIRLQSLLHPLIFQEAKTLSKMTEGPYIIHVVPLLIESADWYNYVDRICVVDCDEATQVARSRLRRGLTSAITQSIILSQISRKDRLEKAEDIISNDKSISMEALSRQTKLLHKHWTKLALSNSQDSSQDKSLVFE